MVDIINKVYVITTYDAHIRHEFIANQMSIIDLEYELRVAPPKQFFTCIDLSDTEKIHTGAQSLSSAYSSLIAESILNKYKIVMIVEDDTKFYSNFKDEFLRFYANLPSNWDFLHLGDYTNNDHIHTENINEYVDKIFIKYTTNCMVLNITDNMVDVYEKIISSRLPIDYVFNHFYSSGLNCYSPTSQLTSQQSYRSGEPKKRFKSMINFKI